MLQIWRIVLLAAGLGCWLHVPLKSVLARPRTVGLLLGVVLVLAGGVLAADFLWPAYDRRYGRRRLIYACGRPAPLSDV